MKKLSRTIIPAAIAILIPALAHAGPVVKFERMDYDFGTVKQGEQLSYEFKFSNAGDADLVIEGINSP